MKILVTGYKLEKSGKLSILVSINCITFNHEEYIADAIESFLMQKTDFDFEIIIGEDCSTDNTKEIVGMYVKLYPEKIKLIESEHNVGFAKNAQRVFDKSRGKYIAECEGDDYWTDPYKLQKQVDYLEENPGCSLSFHAANIVQAPNKPTVRKVKPYNEDRISPMEDFISGGGEFCSTASLVYPRKLMESSPTFFRNSHVGDFPLQLILASQGYAYYIDEFMSVYRKGVKGSWSKEQQVGGNVRDKMIKSTKGDIEILVNFNKYTDSKYTVEISKSIRKKEFEVFLLKKKLKNQRNVKYKKSIKEFGFKEKMKIYAKCYFPKYYLILAEVKANMPAFTPIRTNKE